MPSAAPSPASSSGEYSYGDSAVAGDRLAIVASIFDPTTSAFVREAAPEPVRTVIDLGCGPGFTTRLLAAALPDADVTGLERSAAFVARARADSPVGIVFVEHDVTVVPFPVPAADLVFARLLLAHLPSPARTIERWLTQTRARLLLEEIVRIDSDHPVLGAYIDLVAAMSAAHGNDLFVGAALLDLVPASATVVRSTEVQITPPTATVARMFSMNLTQWRDDPYIVESVDPTVVDTMAADLATLTSSPATGDITWTHHHLALTPTR